MKHLGTSKLILGNALGGAEYCLPASVPKQSSMAVTGVFTALEDNVGVAVEDGDVKTRRLATVGRLTEFVQEMLQP